MRFFFLFLTTALILPLSGCSNPRASLGLTRTPPDEFKVVKNVPLEMPDTLDLPVPQLGAPRPQEQAVDEKIKETLIGTQAETNARPGQAEALLLQQAGVQPGQAEDIRAKIDQEYVEEQNSNISVTQKLLGFGGSKEKDTVLDPAKEAERLKEQQAE